MDPDSYFILSGLEKGFNIVDPNSDITPTETRNSRRAEIQFRTQVEQQIREELRLGRYVTVKHKPKIVSPISCIPKGDGSVRLIHDCSRPQGKAVNDYVEPIEKMAFASVDSAIELVDKGWFMAKVDLRSAYRHCPISLESQSVAGLKWRFTGDKDYTYLVDTRLMFGASRSVNIFHRITQSVVRMLKRRGIQAILCYIDDFFLCAETKSECEKAMNILIDVLKNLGFSISWDKSVYPTTRLTFLGIDIDTALEKVSIPPAKLDTVIETLNTWNTSKKRASKRELQQLIGTMNWVAYVIHAVRPTLRCLIDHMTVLRAPHHRTRISSNLLRTMQTIRNLCITFNGSSLFLRKATPEAAYIVCDSSKAAGGAAVISNSKTVDWIYTNWALDYASLAESHINLKELAIVFLALNRWAHTFANCKVNVYTDNTTTLHSLNRGAMRNTVGSKILCNILVLCSLFNIKLCPVWISTKNNKLADSISRMHELPHATFVMHRVCLENMSLHMSERAFHYILQMWHDRRRFSIWK